MKLHIRLCIAGLVAASFSANGHAATLAGYWAFDNAADIGQATVGSNLSIVGTAPTHSATLTDDSSTSLSGVITTTGGTANRLVMSNSVGGNGGGSFTNEYSFLFDIFSPAASRAAWRALIQTNTGNSNDADYFIRNSNDQLGISTLGYSTSPINDSEWTRLVLTFDINAAGNPSLVKAYVNGSLFHTHSLSGGLDGTYGLESTVLLFADNDAENASLNVGSVAYWDGVLTDSEVSALGSVGSAVPEPTAVMLGSLGALCLLRRRRA